MFKVGDLIIYGNTGVCEIAKIGPLDNMGSSRKRLYYTLRPYYTKDSTIFTPVDNQKVIMRPVLSKDEVMDIVNHISDIDGLWINDERKRETEYREAIKKCDCTELIRIIKTIYSRKQARIANGKKVTSTDEKYFNLAEESLYGEWAISLEMTKDEAKEFVLSKVSSEEMLVLLTT